MASRAERARRWDQQRRHLDFQLRFNQRYVEALEQHKAKTGDEALPPEQRPVLFVKARTKVTRKIERNRLRWGIA